MKAALIPLFAAGVATAVFLYTDQPAVAGTSQAQIQAVSSDQQASAADMTGSAGTAQLDPTKLSILPQWLRDCFGQDDDSAPTTPNLLDPSTWPSLPDPLDPSTWPQNCFGVGNLLQQVPNWLDPSDITDSVEQHIAPQDWNQAQQLIQEARQVGTDPGRLKDLLAKAWSEISKNWWLLVVILVVIGVIVIVAVVSGATGGSSYVFDLDQNDAQDPANHVREHIGVQDDDLCNRMNDPYADVNSTFPNEKAAVNYIAETVRKNDKAIKNWLGRANSGEWRAFHGDFKKEVVGRGIYLDECPDTNRIEDLTHVRIVLEADGNGGFSVRTAFPEF